MSKGGKTLCPYCEQETKYVENLRSNWGYEFVTHKMPKLKDYKANNCPLSGRWITDLNRTKATTKDKK